MFTHSTVSNLNQDKPMPKKAAAKMTAKPAAKPMPAKGKGKKGKM